MARVELGKPLDVSAELPDGTTIDGPEGLRVALVGRGDQFVQTVTKNLFIYAMGDWNERDMPVIRSITRDAARDNIRFSRIIISLVTNPAFQMRTKGSSGIIDQVPDELFRELARP